MMRPVSQCIRTVFLPDVSLHVVAVQGTTGICANVFSRKVAIVAQKVNAFALIVCGPEINIAETATVVRLLAGVATGAIVGKNLLAARDRTSAVFAIELRDQFVEIGRAHV